MGSNNTIYYWNALGYLNETHIKMEKETLIREQSVRQAIPFRSVHFV